MAWLIDTNVLSGIRRPRPDNRVLGFLAARTISELFVSVVTLAEIRFGIENQTDDHRKSLLTSWLAKGGYTFSLPDLLIAATALDRGLVVVSRDNAPFLKANVPVQNPWLHEQMP